MEKKDLAKEYTERTYREKTNHPIMWRDKVFTGKDLEAAFNAGRESVVESMPELEWKRFGKDGPYLAVTVFNWFYRIEFVYNKFHLFCNGYFISCYISLSDSKQAATEHYKKRIKQALGL